MKNIIGLDLTVKQQTLAALANHLGLRFYHNNGELWAGHYWQHKTMTDAGISHRHEKLSELFTIIVEPSGNDTPELLVATIDTKASTSYTTLEESFVAYLEFFKTNFKDDMQDLEEVMFKGLTPIEARKHLAYLTYNLRKLSLDPKHRYIDIEVILQSLFELITSKHIDACHIRTKTLYYVWFQGYNFKKLFKFIGIDNVYTHPLKGNFRVFTPAQANIASMHTNYFLGLKTHRVDLITLDSNDDPKLSTFVVVED